MFRVEYWVISTLFCCGLIAGLILSWPDPAPIEPAEPAADLETVDQTAAAKMLRSLAFDLGLDQQLSLEQTQARVIRQIDQNLLLDNHAGALTLLQNLLRVGGIQRDATLLIRLGLAEERRGSFASAEKAYLQAIKQPATQAVELVGLTGLARVWLLQDKPELALELLNDLNLHSRGYEATSSYLNSEVLSLLAFSAREKAIASIDTQEYELTGVNLSRPDLDLERIIDILQVGTTAKGPVGSEAAETGESIEPATSPGQQAEPIATESNAESIPQDHPLSEAAESATGQELKIMQRTSDLAQEINLDVNSEVLPLTVMLEQLATATGLQFEISGDALPILSGRSKSINVSGASLANVLDRVLCPIHLQWNQNEKTIQIAPQTENSMEFWLQVADRDWSQYLKATEKDRRSAFAWLEQGGLQLLKGNVDDAATQFQHALQNGAKQDLAARVHLNQARISYRLGRFDEATAVLFRAVDVAANKHLTAQAYYLISQISLETGQIDVAITSADRAGSFSQDDSLTVQALLVQMRAYLLDSQPFAANRALFAKRELVRAEPAALIATFLGCYSRYLGSELPEARRNESYRLVGSLAAMEKLPSLSCVDRYLMARAYQSLGFESQAIPQLQMALSETTNAYWQGRILMELAIQLRSNGQREQAAQYLQHLSGLENVELAVAAKIQLVELSFEARDYSGTISAARELLTLKLQKDQQQQLLTMLGYSYRQTGEPYAAALCFAGMLPQEITHQ